MPEDLLSLTDVWVPATEDEREAVRQELSRLLASPELRTSKRYANFLRFGVEHSLLRQTEGLKERAVGIEVFGRPPDYDTSSDPIVRVTASELRKKITHYYSLPEHKRDFKILLPAGSYIPVFVKPRLDTVQSTVVELQVDDKSDISEPVPATIPVPNIAEDVGPKPKRGIWLWLSAFAALLILVLGSLMAANWSRFSSSPVDAFWNPILQSPSSVLVCVPDQPQTEISASNPFQAPAEDDAPPPSLPTFAVSDTLPLVTVASLLHGREKKYSIQGQSSVSLQDLRQGPAVIIGAFDNRWTLQLIKNLRFHFANDPQISKFWIEDRERPDFRGWMRTMAEVGNKRSYVDYALIARYLDPTTGNEIIVAAGLGDAGTAATGDFLSSTQLIKQVFDSTPGKSRSQNIEVVLATDVIGGHAGNPRVLAVTTW